MATANEGRQPILPAKRRRLQQCFEHGSKSAAQGSFDYAADLFTQCVLGDPGNVIYTQQFLKTLHQKYNNNKKGSKLAGMKGMGIQGSIKKASMSKDWPGVIAAGLEMLKLNPWHVPTLTAMAAACDVMEFSEAQLAYLKGAMELDPKDPHVNRLCGRALARVGEFEQAIACWQRVKQAKPGDDEATRAISNLQVEKTISRGGYEDAGTSTDVMADKEAQADRRGGGVQATPEQRLEKLIAKKPEDLGNYLELADIHHRNQRFAESEAVLGQALQVSGGDIMVRERLEETQMHRAREQLVIAQKRAQQEKTEEAVKLAKEMKEELNRVELEIYRNRCERYPTSVGFKFELGLRLKRAGQFGEAIKSLQAARSDSKRQSAVHLELGECFQSIKQHSLAMTNYEEAIQTVAERDIEQRKLALYRAGYLGWRLWEAQKEKEPASAQKYLEKAQKYLTDLASLEYGYKDVSTLLDKISQIRHKG